MIKRILAVTVTTLVLTASAEAAGEFVSPDGAAMDEISSGDFKLGAMVESDYGIGVSAQFGHLLDVKAGHSGAGADFHFWHMKLQTDSAFMNRHPLEFYASAGVGYRWDDSGQGEGVIVRAPGGAVWQFSSNGWSCYLEVAPSFNFGDDPHGDRNGFDLMGGTGIRYNF
ncbi:MAG: hypothetical protein MUP09_06210 [Thiovulaceae bacterium]|nr:hypothetical protein [Sulfurimonadaceae bacterium]